MKQISYTLLTVIAAISFASCEDDFKENGKEIEANAVAFRLDKGVQTRSEDSSHFISRNTYPIGDPVDGVNYFLEETVTRLDDYYYGGPETTGTPVYTENFSDMFSAFYGSAYTASGTTLASSPIIPDGAFSDDGEGLWRRVFAFDPYEDNGTLYFFLRSQQSPEGVSNLAYSLNSQGRSVIEFDYKNPLEATAQQDIIFAARPVTKAEASQPVPVLFHHALSGVKFAAGSDNSGDVKTYITKVEFPHALFRSAHIKITSSKENNEWVDDPDIYSSESACSVSNGQQLKADEIYTLTLADNETVDFETGGKFKDKGKYADSFAAAGNKNNLNDANATKTFWFIPQKMNNNIVMDVTFHVISAGKDSGPITRRVELGKLQTNSVTWKAGELRTFSLKGILLDVDIKDKVSGFEKTDVEIVNTGNVDAFIRAHITANWFGYAGTDYSAAIGFSGEDSDSYVPAWKMSGTSGDNFGGVFEDLPGNGWIQGADGFFYYTKAVPPGQKVPSPLFSKYSVSGSNIPPKVWYVDSKNKRHQFTDVELVMDIPVQAIEAKEDETYRSAWTEAGASL